MGGKWGREIKLVQEFRCIPQNPSSRAAYQNERNVDVITRVRKEKNRRNKGCKLMRVEESIFRRKRRSGVARRMQVTLKSKAHTRALNI